MPNPELLDYTDLLIRFGANVVAMITLTFGLYYRRYHNKELVTAAALFNIFVFAVLVILSLVTFSISAGFGLFAILALFTLRSEQISKTEITYFFGSISIAVITAIQHTPLPLVGMVLALTLLGAFCFDHPRLLATVTSTKVTLDKVPANVLSDPNQLRDELRERLGVEILSYRVTSVDYITDMVRATVHYRS